MGGEEEEAEKRKQLRIIITIINETK